MESEQQKLKQPPTSWTMIDVLLGSGWVLFMLGLAFLTYQIQIYAATLLLMVAAIGSIVWLYRRMAHIRPMDAQDPVEGRLKIFSIFGIVTSTLLLLPITLVAAQIAILYRDQRFMIVLVIAFTTWLVLIFFFARRLRRRHESFEDYQQRLGLILNTPHEYEPESPEPPRKKREFTLTPTAERQRRVVVQPQPLTLMLLLAEIVWLSLILLGAVIIAILYLLEADYLLGLFTIVQIVFLLFFIFFNIRFLRKNFKHQDLTAIAAIGLVLFFGIAAILVLWGWPVFQANPTLGDLLPLLVFASIALSTILHEFRSRRRSKMR